MDSKSANVRLRVLLVVFGLCVAGLWLRLFCLQTVASQLFRDIASDNHNRKITIPAVRGKVFDRRGDILAISVPGKSVFVSPLEVARSETTDFAQVARALSRALGSDAGALEKKLSRRPKREFAWVKRLISAEEEASVRALRLDGVHIREESRRFYPFGSMLAQVIGFTGVDQQGLSGVEFVCDKYLSGKDGYRRTHRDARARTITNPSLEYVPAEDGRHVVLTIDANIQDFLERAIDRSWLAHRPKAVIGIILDPRTGDILALAQRPTFDPAEYADSGEKTWRLRAVTDSFEPGSMFKPFVFAAALEDGLVELDEMIFCENGEYRIGGRLLHDHHPYGQLSATNIVVKSSNIGMAKIGQRLGPVALRRYLDAFGFGRPTGLGFEGESPGRLAKASTWSHYTLTSIPMGHEVAVNAVQIAAGFAVFANGGYLVKPRILRGVLSADEASSFEHFSPVSRRRVLSEATAKTMLSNVLREVVVAGTGWRANLEDYAVAGKTGTAQKLVDVKLPSGKIVKRYSHNKYISSFVCTAPVQDPRAVVLLVVDEPSEGPGRYGGSVAAPYAAEALEATLDYILIDERRRGGSYTTAGAPHGAASTEATDAP